MAHSGTLSVSVALCTHNGARYLETQLASILAQTVLPAELVLSDDASTDDSIAIVRRVMKGSPVAFRVLANDPPLGVAKNFAQALQGCTSDLVALCDQDDYWQPNRLERIIAEFEARPELLLVHTDARLVDAGGASTGVTLLDSLEVTDGEKREIHSGHAFDALLRRNLVTGATTVVRRELVERAMPVPPGWIHDEWLAIMGAATGSMDLLEEPLVDYRQHGGNQIGARKPTLRDKIRKLREPRTERNDNLLERAEGLQARVAALGLPDDRQALVAAKLEHERLRHRLPANRSLRVAPVLREAAGGGYRRFSRGRIDVLRDLIQPV